MVYCTVADVAEYLDIDSPDDDPLITDKISAAQAAIDKITRRTFEDPGAATRYFTVGVDTDGAFLYFDKDIYSIVSVTNDADGDADAVTASDYITQPRNETPYYAIKLLTSKNVYWKYSDDPETGIEENGHWAYSATAPDDIVHVCVRWAAYLYRQRDAQVFDTIAIPSAGIIQIPQGLPKDVALMLDRYVKPAL